MRALALRRCLNGPRAAPRLVRCFATLTPSPAERDTIFALATASGRGGLAVFRVSGPAALDVYRAMVRVETRNTGRAASVEPPPWRFRRCSIVDPHSANVLDDGLAVFFRGPRSFTRQDTLELHTHGGRAVANAVLAALARVRGCRPAAPGEFTRRALIAGRLDITQAEGLADLIAADTDAQRRLARAAAAGGARRRVEDLRVRTIACLAMIEALIDFGEGEDLESGIFEAAAARVAELRDTIAGHLSDGRRGEILRAGIRVAIFGPPNAGKSSLFNFFAQRDAALVTPVPGTTRDVLHLTLDLSGLPVHLSDTAGLRATNDQVEQLGIARARSAVDAADVALCVVALPEAATSIPPDIAELLTPQTIVLLNKADLAPALPAVGLGTPHVWAASVTTGVGMPAFVAGLTSVLRARFDADASEEPLITHARHREHLTHAVRYLDAFLATPPDDVVLAAEELRYAANEIGRISGAIGVEEVLDALFSQFCIGK